MPQSTNLSPEVENIVDIFFDKIVPSSILELFNSIEEGVSITNYDIDTVRECFKASHSLSNYKTTFMISLYAMSDCADQKALELLKDNIINLRQYYNDEEINFMLQNPHTVVEAFNFIPLKNSWQLLDDIVNLSASLVADSIEKRVYLPFAGDGIFLDIVGKNAECIGFEHKPQLWAHNQVRQYLLGKSANITLNNSFEVQGQFDCIFVCPPIEIIREMQDVIQHFTKLTAYHLAEQGKMVCLLPSAFCYAMGSWRQLRETIADNELSATVVLLPKGLLYPQTGIELCLVVIENNHLGNIMLVDTSDCSFIEPNLFTSMYVTYNSLNIDAIHEVITSKDEALVWTESAESFITAQYLTPLPSGWITAEEEEFLLDSIIEKVNTKSVEEESEYRVLSIDYLNNNYLNCDIDILNLPKKKRRSGKIITEDCIVMSRLNHNLLIGRVYGASAENPVVLGNFVHAYKIREIEKVPSLAVSKARKPRKVLSFLTEEYLLKCLTANELLLEMDIHMAEHQYFYFMFGAPLIDSLKLGDCDSSVPLVKQIDFLLPPPHEIKQWFTHIDKNLNDNLDTEIFPQATARKTLPSIIQLYLQMSEEWFREFPYYKIFVPNLTEQFKRYKADVVDSLKAADLRIQKAYDEYRKDVRMKKHAIGQTVFNLKNWWDNLNLARQKGNGVVSDADTIGVTRKIAVAEIYQNLDITMSKLSTQLDKFDSGYGLSREEFALPTFLEQYIAAHRSPDFTFEYNANAYRWNNEGETNDTNVDKQPSITFSKEALTRVLDNIVNNARTHGFQGRLNEQNKIKLVIQAQGTDYILIVANNGAPLKDDFKKEDVFVYGQTSGETQKHFGIGGYEIKRLMNEFEGDVELVANSESEYSVAYKLIFHNTHIIND